tara:strand:+ start:239 stop:583 length:345 start_codon:yes stop_codon:yes gene_type:complete
MGSADDLPPVLNEESTTGTPELEESDPFAITGAGGDLYTKKVGDGDRTLSFSAASLASPSDTFGGGEGGTPFFRAAEEDDGKDLTMAESGSESSGVLDGAAGVPALAAARSLNP